MTLSKLPYKRHKDRISQLPEPILHNILSFPTTNFNHNYFNGGIRTSKKFKEVVRDFTNYVDKMITRCCCMDTISIQKFNLVVHVKRTHLKSRWQDFERWLNFAVSNNVEQLSFFYIDLSISKKELPYDLPTSSPLICANKTKSLKELELYGCKFVNKSDIDQIRSSLRNLKLERVDIDNQTLQSLLSNCSTSLEKLSIRNCRGFDLVNVCSTKLESVDLDLSRFQVQKIALEAQNLRFLSYAGGVRSVLSSFEASNFNKNLIKELSFHDIAISDAMIRLIIREFRVLEKLELFSCRLEDNVRISRYNRFSKNIDRCIAVCWKCHYKGNRIGDWKYEFESEVV